MFDSTLPQRQVYRYNFRKYFVVNILAHVFSFLVHIYHDNVRKHNVQSCTNTLSIGFFINVRC